ncbi:hypothetical protein [Hymenobacter persicinus]|uniref:Outer membrane protein beta-barrel domain-containing protein n=1 Tax=Hymenobacter persicinus TaxID=2025506 RepID=A0A4Q5LDJ9_9BACT|nr:hypothetical protein [Hymenobacter persicinus]RYU78350.1 hypothetical protein EWM57_14355 [Hymenobacter persicinus]
MYRLLLLAALLPTYGRAVAQTSPATTSPPPGWLYGGRVGVGSSIHLEGNSGTFYVTPTAGILGGYYSQQLRLALLAEAVYERRHPAGSPAVSYLVLPVSVRLGGGRGRVHAGLGGGLALPLSRLPVADAYQRYAKREAFIQAALESDFLQLDSRAVALSALVRVGLTPAVRQRAGSPGGMLYESSTRHHLLLGVALTPYWY